MGTAPMLTGVLLRRDIWTERKEDNVLAGGDSRPGAKEGPEQILPSR